MPVHWTGQAGKVADQLNDIIGANEALGTELDRASRIVGKEGKLSHRVSFKGTDQVWGQCIESVNEMIDDLVRPSNEMQRVIGAVADGDLSKKVSVDVHGEMLVLKNTINGMVDQLNGFVSEVTRVAREVGTEGKLGQAGRGHDRGRRRLEGPDRQRQPDGRQPHRPGARHRRGHHRGGQRRPEQEDHRRRRGRVPRAEEHRQRDGRPAQRFAGEVTRVAREVGVEGKLGGQAQSKEVAGSGRT
jgi:HAMP domain-containing protein